MGSVSDVSSLAVQLLSDPIVRAITMILAIISFVVSMLAFKRTSAVMSSHYANLRAEQERFLEMQWSNVNSLVISNSDCASLVAEMFGVNDSVGVKKELVHRSFVKVLAAAFSAQRNQALDAAAYESHMQYFFSNYKGDGAYLMRVIETAHYHPDFEADCRARLAKRAKSLQPPPHMPLEASAEQSHLRSPLPALGEGHKTKA